MKKSLLLLVVCFSATIQAQLGFLQSPTQTVFRVAAPTAPAVNPNVVSVEQPPFPPAPQQSLSLTEAFSNLTQNVPAISTEQPIQPVLPSIVQPTPPPLQITSPDIRPSTVQSTASPFQNVSNPTQSLVPSTPQPTEGSPAITQTASFLNQAASVLTQRVSALNQAALSFTQQTIPATQPNVAISQPATPTIPNVPSFNQPATPAIPNTPSFTQPATPKVPSLTQPATPAIPNAPSFAQPATPTIPNTPSFTQPATPKVPSLTQPATPAIPNAPSFAQPATPAVPNAPSFAQPATPAIPNTPSFTQPAMPTVPNVPSFEQPATPAMPTVPSFAQPVLPSIQHPTSSSPSFQIANAGIRPSSPNFRQIEIPYYGVEESNIAELPIGLRFYEYNQINGNGLESTWTNGVFVYENSGRYEYRPIVGWVNGVVITNQLIEQTRVPMVSTNVSQVRGATIVSEKTSLFSQGIWVGDTLKYPITSASENNTIVISSLNEKSIKLARKADIRLELAQAPSIPRVTIQPSSIPTIAIQVPDLKSGSLVNDLNNFQSPTVTAPQTGTLPTISNIPTLSIPELPATPSSGDGKSLSLIEAQNRGLDIRLREVTVIKWLWTTNNYNNIRRRTPVPYKMWVLGSEPVAEGFELF